MRHFLSCLVREVCFCQRSLLFLWLLFLAPVAGTYILDGLFGEGFIRDIPSAIVDLDQSSSSRDLVRQIEALPSLKISSSCSSLEEGYRRVRSGQSFCLVVVPRNFQKDLLKGGSPRLEAWIDGQHMAAAGVVRKELTEMGRSFWTSFYAHFLAGKGSPMGLAVKQASSVGIDLHSIANPASNYQMYLPHAFFPVLWQLVLLIWLCFRLHEARKEGLDDGGALLGRILPGTMWAWLCCCMTGIVLSVRGQSLFIGGLATLFLVYLLVLLAVAGLALLLAGLGDELLQSLVFASALASPAFAFSGVSFPLESMPFFARLWAAIIPLSHGMTLEVFLGQLGAPLLSQWREILVLSMQILFYGGCGLLLHSLRRRAKTGLQAEWKSENYSLKPLTFCSAFFEEVRFFSSNKGALSIFLIGVTFYALLYPSPYSKQVPQKMPVAVVDEDKSSIGRMLIRMASASEGMRIAMACKSPTVALEQLRQGTVSAVLCIPRDFERKVLKGESAQVSFYCNAAQLLSYSKILDGLSQATEALGAGIRLTRLEKGGVTKATATALQTRGRVHTTTLYNPAGNYALNTVPPVLVIILQQTLLIGTAMLVAAAVKREKRRIEGTPFFVLTGRLLFPVLIYFGYVCLYFRFLTIACDLPVPKDFGSFLLFIFPFLVSSAAIGYSIGLVLKDSCLILATVLPTSLPLLFLSGFVWPRACMPAFFQTIGTILPDLPAIEGAMCLLLRGARFQDVLSQWIHLWGLVGLWLGLAWMLSLLYKRAGFCKDSLRILSKSVYQVFASKI